MTSDKGTKINSKSVIKWYVKTFTYSSLTLLMSLTDTEVQDTHTHTYSCTQRQKRKKATHTQRQKDRQKETGEEKKTIAILSVVIPASLPPSAVEQTPWPILPLPHPP